MTRKVNKDNSGGEDEGEGEGGEHGAENQDTTTGGATLSPGRVRPGITSAFAIHRLARRRSCCDRARPRVSYMARVLSPRFTPLCLSAVGVDDYFAPRSFFFFFRFFLKC